MEDPYHRDQVDRLTELMASFESVVVAFSGGVDSALVAALAHHTLGERAVAVTAAAETLAGAELDDARRVAREIGIEHEIVTYSELDNPDFVRNPSFRCYVCQGMRMDWMLEMAKRRDFAVVCDGTNASDPGPNRPGLAAIKERGVRSPLLECGIDKATTRVLAKQLGLTVWDRPANACLSSRIPHGQVVTLVKLRRIEAAEEAITALGFPVVRVRHEQRVARVEVPLEDVERLRGRWLQVESLLLTRGFDAAVLDARGYTSGGADLPLEEPRPLETTPEVATKAAYPR